MPNSDPTRQPGVGVGVLGALVGLSIISPFRASRLFDSIITRAKAVALHRR